MSVLCRAWWPAALLLLLAATPVVAQDDILVSTADPDMTEQGTYDLDVIVGGDNFPADPAVDFYVTGTTDRGGITVKKVKRQGPKNLKVTIDVAEDAQFQFRFDIQVRGSNGRSGKGTELFRVQEKTHPTQDTIPPGAPVDLHTTEVSYSTVTLAWTMPADDGYDAATGAAMRCDYWKPNESAWNRFSHCLGDPGVGGQPWPDAGEQQICIMNWLEPETSYLYRVRCVDDSGNWSNEAQLGATTRPFSEFQDPTWAIEEVPVPLDALVGHGFGAAGDLVIAGVVGLWDQAGKGAWGVVPTVIRVITGLRDEGTGAWAWSYEDLPGFAHRLEMDPQGRPTFEGSRLRDPKKRLRDLVYTFHDGVGWQTEVVTTEPGLSSPHGFAFDPAGNPAIGWCSQDSVGGVRLARRDPTGQWSIEQVSPEECSDRVRGAGLAFDDDGNPAISYRLEPEEGPATVKAAIWSGQDWLTEVVCSEPDCPESAISIIGIMAPTLIYDSARGGFSGAADENRSWLFGCDRIGPGDWQCTSPVFGQLGQGGFGGSLLGQGSRVGDNVLEADATGEMFIAHGAENGPGVALSRRLSGVTVWTQEHVDYYSTRGLPSLDDGLDPGGPYVALDPSGQPTLTWTWNIGGDPPSEHHLYFAWKAP